MNPEKQARVKDIRQKLANITPELKAELAARGLVATVEGKTLSPHNTFMVYLQGNGVTPSVVGGYKQWKSAGRQVKRGEHGFIILFPVGSKDADTGDILKANWFYTGTVFDISQTMAIDASRPEPEPEPAPPVAPAIPQPVEAPQPVDQNIMKGWQIV